MTSLAARCAQEYFNYGMMTMCGIREVIMDGTLADWQALRAKVARLGALGTAGAELQPWLSVLDRTLRRLVDTYEGHPDAEFWSRLYSQKTTHGSGAGTFMSGWFLHFFLYSADGYPIWPLANRYDRYRGDPTAEDTPLNCVRQESLPVGYASVPFFWKRLSGEKREFLMYTGTWATAVAADGVVSPVTEWAVVEVDADAAKSDAAATAGRRRF